MSLGKKPKRQPVPTNPPKNRAELKALYGEVWSTEELGRTFVVTAIIANKVVVRRKSDDAVGTMDVQEGPPQFYYRFTPKPTED